MHSAIGAMAEWLGTGLQNLLQRFDSASHLQKSPPDIWRALFVASETKRNVLFDNLLCVYVEAKHFLLTFVSEIKTEPSLTYLYNIKSGPCESAAFFHLDLLQNGVFMHIFAYLRKTNYLQYHGKEIRL